MSALADKLASWEKIIAENKVTVIEPDEKTPAMFAKETGLSMSRSSQKLLQMYRNGELTRRKIGGHGWAYRVKGKE